MTIRPNRVAHAFRLVRQGLLGGVAGLCLVATAASAQEVVQALPDPASADLNDALQRLSRDPNSLGALIDAGSAALALSDNDAAVGFFNRAQRIAPSDGRVLAGLAQVAVRRGQATIAVQLFDNAEAAGNPMTTLAAERGLAYDLTGDNQRAQRLYRQAMTREDEPETARRLAISYAISGDAAASEQVLLPLLNRQDRAAYRARAFALAILGRDEEAVSIAEAMLPATIAQRLIPYLRYMPRLTNAQQAAAANLGRFPAASQIGRDDPQIAVATSAPAVRSGAPDQRLIPGGAPLGPTATAVPAPAPEPAPQSVIQWVSEPEEQEVTGELPALAAAQDEPRFVQQPLVQAPVPEPAVAEPVPAPPAGPAEAPLTVFALEQPAAPPPIAETQAEEPEISLADAFAGFIDPDPALPLTAAAGAVDITAIEPRRERPPPPPAPPPPPPPPPHPSRHWVQIATGQDTEAFAFDWRRVRRNADGLLDGRNAFHARWGQTNRLLTGPFDSAAAANAFVRELTGKGLDAFRFTSSAGEEVRPLQ